MKYDYIKSPAAIYEKSFRLAAASCDYSRFSDFEKSVVLRMVHACSLPAIVPDLLLSSNFIASAEKALRQGFPILVDCLMVKYGIIRRFLPCDNKIICCVNDEETLSLSKEKQITRSAAAVDLWAQYLPDALVVIGNAPTALFALLEKISTNNKYLPAALIALPVGFVGAADSKSALIEFSSAPNFLTLKGRYGGSSLAAAVVNGLSHNIKGMDGKI